MILPINTVMLPCEIKSREFDSKLLLACLLAERGLTSYVGSRNLLHLKLGRIPRSVYLGKDVRHSSKQIALILKMRGHVFVAHDEEAQFYYSRERYRSFRVHPDVLQATDALVAWGPDNALAWSESNHYKGTPIHVLGNGRIDLMRHELRALYDEQVRALRVRHGRFALINTNFGGLNHFYSHLTVMKPPSDDEEPQSWEDGLARHRYRVYNAFRELLLKLAARYPNTQIVLRPHPGENHETWRDLAKGHPNVIVTHDGSVIPWVLASSCIIHNSCTTGLEAYLLDAYPIAYQPVKSNIYDLHLPNDLSHVVHTDEELLALVGSVCAGAVSNNKLRNPARAALLAQHIVSTEGQLASEKYAALIAKKCETAPLLPSALSRLTGFVRAEARALLKRRQMVKPGHKANEAYTLHRFPNTTLAEVRNRVGDFSRALNRFPGVQVTEFSRNIFVIKADSRNVD